MASNRDYTGLQRTPSSMAWLIRRRSIAKGQMDRLTRDLDRLPAAIALFEAEIAHLDAIIPLHEVVVDPQEIKGKRPFRPRLAAPGVMAKAILECLRLAKGRPVYKTEVAMHFIRRANLNIDEVGRSYVLRRVQQRMKAMCAAGQICKHHPSEVGFNGEGMWTLPPDDEPSS